MLHIYTDGACRVHNENTPGGWSIIIVNADDTLHYLDFGCEMDTTNNRMELTAMIKALSYCRIYPGSVAIYSDSAYVVNGLTKGWVKSWIKKGWKTSKGTPVQNIDLWQKAYELYEMARAANDVMLKHVAGHSGNQYNELADTFATSAIDGRAEALANTLLQRSDKEGGTF